MHLAKKVSLKLAFFYLTVRAPSSSLVMPAVYWVGASHERGVEK
jgi:hypothetical protein